MNKEQCRSSAKTQRMCWWWSHLPERTHTLSHTRFIKRRLLRGSVRVKSHRSGCGEWKKDLMGIICIIDSWDVCKCGLTMEIIIFILCFIRLFLYPLLQILLSVSLPDIVEIALLLQVFDFILFSILSYIYKYISLRLNLMQIRQGLTCLYWPKTMFVNWITPKI